MPQDPPQHPVNLTAATERTSWTQAAHDWCRGQDSTGRGLQIRGLDRAADGDPCDGLVDTVYVIATGYGVLNWGDTALEFTAGDVLFVPSGHAHRFERLDGEIMIWRIYAASAPDATNP